MRRGCLFVIFLLAVVGAMCSPAWADPPSCTPFADGGCFFGENFENGTISGWTTVNNPIATNTTPGLNGTGHKVTIHGGAATNARWELDTNAGIGNVAFNTVIYLEWYFSFPSGFVWSQGDGSGGGSVSKFFDQRGADNTGQALNRWLISMHAPDGNQTATSTRLQVSMYPNFGTGGSDAGQVTNNATEKTADAYVITGGVEYHCVWEIKLASGTAGYYKLFCQADGGAWTTLLSFANLQTWTAVSGTPQLTELFLGGIWADILSQSYSFDQIRYTTTNISPGGGSDTTPPFRSSGAPSGTLPAGTTSTTISLSTPNEFATCRYSTSSGVAYGSMTNTFTATGGNAHSTTVSGLSNNATFTYNVRCIDAASNANPDDFGIAFFVAPSGGGTGPVRSNPGPSGTLAVGVTATTLVLTTDVNATCKISATPSSDTAASVYTNMPYTFTTTGGTSHANAVSGLITPFVTYDYYVRCIPVAGGGDPNTTDLVIEFTTGPATALSKFNGVLLLKDGALRAK